MNSFILFLIFTHADVHALPPQRWIESDRITAQPMSKHACETAALTINELVKNVVADCIPNTSDKPH